VSEDTKPELPSHRNPRFVVRCGNVRTLHVCTTRELWRHGDRVIVRTPRGMELGEVLSEATPEALAWLDSPPGGQIMRRVSESDEIELARLKHKANDEFDTCAKCIRELDLQMDLVDVEHLFGGERIVVYYLAEGRIDFRDLVKRLCSELQTRVEMRQIGVRDEAKLLADFGDCGKPVCCNTHLTKMPPVSMRMAKMQKATLDPNKISGRCGRLKCCLRYEFDTYEELQRELPPIGSEIVTANGKGTVLNQEILSQQLLVQTEDNRRIMLDVSDVLSVIRRGNGQAISRSRGRREESSPGRAAPAQQSRVELEALDLGDSALEGQEEENE
jgi:cell fate regulator YaaT (PSP1 superfamily)